MLDLAQGPDHLAGNALAFLVTIGDREANKKLDSFRVASEDLGLEGSVSSQSVKIQIKIFMMALQSHVGRMQK